jgi:hypothetical protein
MVTNVTLSCKDRFAKPHRVAVQSAYCYRPQVSVVPWSLYRGQLLEGSKHLQRFITPTKPAALSHQSGLEAHQFALGDTTK